MRHGETISIEDTFRNFIHEAYYTTIQSDGGINSGDLVAIDSSTGYATAFTGSGHFYALIGICIGEPEVNKLGYPNPVNIAIGGIAVLNVSTATFSVGDSLYVKQSDGSIVDQSGIAGLTIRTVKRLGVIMEIVDSNHAKLFLAS